jgi:hypothetical protein
MTAIDVSQIKLKGRSKEELWWIFYEDADVYCPPISSINSTYFEDLVLQKSRY